MKNIDIYGTTCYNFEDKLGRTSFSGLSDILILESDPNPNYYSWSNFPPNKHQKSWRLYLLIKKSINCFQDRILRQSYIINEKLSLDIGIHPGQIVFKNKETQCIRINTDDTSSLEAIINELKKTGIEFIKDSKEKDFETKIFYKKYTELIKMQEGVYRDSKAEGMYFFEIDRLIEWDVFIEGMKKIKNNCNFHLFDAFLSFNIAKGKAVDYIGIYSKHCEEERFTELKENIKNVFSS
ncbi:MAG: hypothetical protein KAG37_07280 [Flavobacteriales bacterium]|nr:hypothetical protein [Flavobacteriales bacterium]